MKFFLHVVKNLHSTGCPQADPLRANPCPVTAPRVLMPPHFQVGAQVGVQGILYSSSYTPGWRVVGSMWAQCEGRQATLWG